MRSLVLISLPAGIGIGICEVAIPAFSDAIGSQELAGVLLAVWSAGQRRGRADLRLAARRPPLERVHQAVAILLALALLPMAAAPSFAVDGCCS